MWEYVRAVQELGPRWLLWENVPGALSSRTRDAAKGDDFRCLLSALDDLGYGLAWRVLDAQFFGVAQRRRRVFLVGCLGDPGSAAEVLLEQENLRWDHPSSREKRQELAAAAGIGAPGCHTLLVRCGKDGGGKGALVQDDVNATLSTANSQTVFQPIGFAGKASASAGTIGAVEEQSPTLMATRKDACVCYAIPGNVIGRSPRNGGNGTGYEDDGACYTLTATDVHGVVYGGDDHES